MIATQYADTLDETLFTALVPARSTPESAAREIFNTSSRAMQLYAPAAYQGH